VSNSTLKILVNELKEERDNNRLLEKEIRINRELMKEKDEEIKEMQED